MNTLSKDMNLWLGLVAFVIGAVILLQLFEIIPENTWDYLWPSILIVTGLKLMITDGETAPEPKKAAAPKKAPAKKKRRVAKK
jgi:hypothetical protein